MGRPGQELPPGWDATPGARGCTPQSCSFRDRHVDFQELGYTVLGLSSQTHEAQVEAARRLHLPYELVSDPEMVLARELSLPIFQVAGMNSYKRLTLVVVRGSIVKVFYPVFPPQLNAEEVLTWLRVRKNAL
jgi:peroxiredoxin